MSETNRQYHAQVVNQKNWLQEDVDFQMFDDLKQYDFYEI